MQEFAVRKGNQPRSTKSDEIPGKEAETRELKLGGGVYRPNKMEVHLEGGITRLPYEEAQIVTVLFEHTNRPLDRTKLLHLVCGDDSFFHSTNPDVYIRELRQHLE